MGNVVLQVCFLFTCLVAIFHVKIWMYSSYYVMVLEILCFLKKICALFCEFRFVIINSLINCTIKYCFILLNKKNKNFMHNRLYYSYASVNVIRLIFVVDVNFSVTLNTPNFWIRVLIYTFKYTWHLNKCSDLCIIY